MIEINLKRDGRWSTREGSNYWISNQGLPDLMGWRGWERGEITEIGGVRLWLLPKEKK